MGQVRCENGCLTCIGNHIGGDQGAVSIKRCCLTSIGIPMLKIRRSRPYYLQHGNPIPGKDCLCIETGPRSPWWNFLYWQDDVFMLKLVQKDIWFRGDSRFALSQWETVLLCNDVSHWLGASLESALWLVSLCWENFSLVKLVNLITLGHQYQHFSDGFIVSSMAKRNIILFALNLAWEHGCELRTIVYCEVDPHNR